MAENIRLINRTAVNLKVNKFNPRIKKVPINTNKKIIIKRVIEIIRYIPKPIANVVKAPGTLFPIFSKRSFSIVLDIGSDFLRFNHSKLICLVSLNLIIALSFNELLIKVF